STSIYRGELLGKLKIPFEQVDPAYQESARTGESPRKMALRLALGKAQSAVSRIEPHSPFIVIGCDQVAHIGAQVFGKPGSFEAASRQLATCSGNWVSFTTAICLIDERGRRHQGAKSVKRHRPQHSRHYAPHECGVTVQMPRQLLHHQQIGDRIIKPAGPDMQHGTHPEESPGISGRFSKSRIRP
ncbi:MAG: Maf family protein, partial [Planctomycetes bacterium]|nr:Maf family protein [Planctomycetota bacterium]